MDIKEFIKQLRVFLDSADGQYLLGKRKENFVETLNVVEKDIDFCDKNENISWGIETPLPIIDTLKYLLAVLNEQVITEESSKFIESYSILIFNHNTNTHKNNEVSLLSQTLNRFVNLRMTSVELLQNLKMISNKLKDLNRVGFQPIELSKHYLASFDKEKNNK